MKEHPKLMSQEELDKFGKDQYDSGFEDGYAQGQQDGSTEGHSEGYADGLAENTSSIEMYRDVQFFLSLGYSEQVAIERAMTGVKLNG